jgi:hypothetical protein
MASPTSDTPANEPFRDDELKVQIAALREQRDALAKQRDARLAELRHLRRFRWGPFFLAFFVPPGLIVLAMVASAFIPK